MSDTETCRGCVKPVKILDAVYAVDARKNANEPCRSKHVELEARWWHRECHEKTLRLDQPCGHGLEKDYGVRDRIDQRHEVIDAECEVMCVCDDKERAELIAWALNALQFCPQDGEPLE